MSDLIQSSFDYAALPIDAATAARAAAERIKLRLKRTVEDIIEIGRELTEVKEKLGHGQFLPWIAAEFEMSQQTANNFTAVYEKFGGKLLNFSNFKPSILYALAAPSTPDAVVEKAIEKAESGNKVTVADVKDWKAELEAERQAREASERKWKETVNYYRERDESSQHELILERQRSAEWKDQWKAERDKQAEIPEDYKTAKARLATLETELITLKKEQAKLVNDQVKAKLRERESELAEMERRKTIMEEQVERMKTYMASLESDVKRAEVHQKVIEEQRLHLISLAAFIGDMDQMRDHDTIRRWLALADMHMEAANSIRLVFGETKPRLAAI